jgi:hypothetical protein
MKPRTKNNSLPESSRHRAHCAVSDGGGGAQLSAAVPAAAGSAALDMLLERSRTLAARVRSGQIAFLDAVDMAHSAAEFAGLVDRYGDDAVQAVLAEAFATARVSL